MDMEIEEIQEIQEGMNNLLKRFLGRFYKFSKEI